VSARPEPERFQITGTVQEAETGRRLAKLVVRAFDRDLLSDDKVGVATTDEDGRFEIQYTSADFSDLRETRPDLYLRVYDAQGTALLLETTDAIRWNASRDENYRLLVPAAALRRAGQRG
jgi:hypothetical protein